MKGVNGAAPSQPVQPQGSDGPRGTRTNSSLVVAFEELRGRMNTRKLADDSRRVTRKSKGLNPDAPRPKNENPLPPKDEREKQNQKAGEKANRIQSMDEHKIPLEELCYRFGTSLELGLTTEAAIKRNLEEGDNKLPEKKKTPGWIRFLLELTNWFSIMLWVGAILCVVTFILQPTQNQPNLYLGIVLVAVILLTGTITYMQTAKSEALM